MKEHDETYSYYRAVQCPGLFGEVLDKSTIFHKLEKECVICKFVQIEADDYFMSYMDIMADIGPYLGLLQDESSYTKDPKVYFKEMQRNYDDAKKILRGVTNEHDLILSYGDGPGIMLMAAASLGIPFKRVKAYDPYLSKYSIFPMLDKRYASMPVYDLVICCHSYSTSAS